METPIRSRTRADFDAMAATHDSSLPAWGPYSKIMAGIARIEDNERGSAFNLSVFPAVYRGRSPLPTETVESNFHPWYAAGDLSFYTYRFELEWKDRVYCDVSYIRLAPDAYLIEADAVNNTELPQQLGFHYVASMQFPRDGGAFAEWVKPVCAGKFTATDGVLYDSLSLASRECADRLVYDGKFLCEITGGGMTHGRALGGRFGKTPGDTVTYTLPSLKTPHTKITLRARGHAVLALSGAASGEIELDTDAFTLCTVPIGETDGSPLTLTLTCISGSGAMIDCFTVSDETVAYVPDAAYFVPRLTEDKNRLTLAYRDGAAYGVVWAGTDHMTREFFASDWERLMDRYVMNHVARTVRGDGREHYTDLYARPFFLAPHSRTKYYGMVCRGTPDELAAHFARFDASDPAALADAARAALPPQNADEYALSQRIMNATLLTNIVYPVYVQGKFIRHFTPGKWWDSLYTWDSGFIALGLAALDTDRALDTLNCYLTDKGNPHAAFIHHGSPVPVQAYVYKDLWDRTGSRDYLASFYPRLRQYYEFLLGRAPGSTTRRLASGLLNTFDYFYNSGGWDDYPPQVEVHRLRLEKTVCPAVSSVHAIVFARILRHASILLGLGEEARYDADIASLADALQRYAWDADAGYFGYVTHGADGRPSGILRDGGVNFNMGLDGAEALLAGICSPAQEEALVSRVMDPARMWTDCGISTVDRTAPYYRVDGYWNGAVWMPHQWFMFLAMLALCRAEEAAKIAETALEVWRRETDETYNSYEHFILTSGRGGGWHHFGGLSAPVVLWYHALLVPGTVTAPPDVFVTAAEFNEDRTAATVRVDAGPALRAESMLFLAAAPGRYRVTVNGETQNAPVFRRAVAVRVPNGQASEITLVRTDGEV